MIELLSLLGGGIFRLLPEVLKFFTGKQDNNHEYRMTQLQYEIDKQRAQANLDLANLQASAQQSAADMAALIEAVKSQGIKTGIGWVDALNSTVRPFLTYYHLIVVYSLVKIAQFWVAYSGGVPWAQVIISLYTPEDRALAWSMASFWFVDRSLRKPGRLS